MTAGVRRFIEYARGCGYEPRFVEMKPGDGATTLVYATDKTYFLVFMRRGEQRIPRKTVKKLIGYRDKDLLVPYRQGMLSVRAEMEPGLMSPFVSENFRNFSLYLDRRSFENGDAVFPADAEHAFSLPSCAVKTLLVSLYGEEKVHVAELVSS